MSTLIHHQGWKAKQIEEFLLLRADEQVAQWEAQGEDGLLISDGTVLEKPESLKAEGLCAVRSSKAKRLTYVKMKTASSCAWSRNAGDAASSRCSIEGMPAARG